MSLNIIQATFDTLLASVCEENGFDYYSENVSVSTNGDYVQSVILPASNQGVGYARSSDDFVGIYQINLMAEKSNGSFWHRQATDRILAAFRRGLKIENVLIESSYVSAGFSYEDLYILVPISINYRAFFGGIDNPYIPPEGGLNIWGEPNIWG